jgi:NAD(P)-dependent dehydrogenase (short-subunit alcohol dehydrogenase family)
MKRLQLKGKVALITGAGSGIGRALAVDASRRGMSVALVGRQPAPLEETRSLLDPGALCLIIPADVRNTAARAEIRERVTRAWGVLHVLVNNAGVVLAGPLGAASDDELRAVIDTNLFAPLALSRDLLPLLRAGAPASVVNIGSLVGDVALPLFVPYAASKFGLRGFSNALRREWAALGIGVTYAAPRGARTEAARRLAPVLDRLATPLDAPAAIAVQVWDAVASGRDSVYPRGRERFVVLLERLLPSLVTAALRRQFARGGLIPGRPATTPFVPDPM